jgi:hypothetical protein
MEIWPLFCVYAGGNFFFHRSGIIIVFISIKNSPGKEEQEQEKNAGKAHC